MPKPSGSSGAVGGERMTYKSVPWEGNSNVQEYQRLFKLIDSEPGNWIPRCGLRGREELHANSGTRDYENFDAKH
jgi:hypothetical protein